VERIGQPVHPGFQLAPRETFIAADDGDTVATKPRVTR
jgi:hypothetical protein